MKLLKTSIVFLTVSVMVVLVILLFAKKDYVFEQTISIDNDSSEVYNFLKFFKNQAKYNDWYIQNDAENEFLGEDGTTSAVFRWTSANYYLRSGTQTIQKMTYPESIRIEIQTDKPYNITGNQEFLMKEKEGVTDLTWKINVRFPFPYNVVILSDNFDKGLSESMKISLGSIKKELEK